ncbi:response regulator [Acetobacterium tundrae]|uniref:Stage 0 sporulation protein A homolog n=1 Tax=Acetobacterium tundrae TaxID=132932 RepID=A0ABR6WKY5_9FIRM|nr:response regulator [Acetobacterium tundrae]MBC3796933.1 response regulator [Acetobacterium tundrae]
MELKTILYVDDNPLDIELTLEAIKENHILNPIIVANDGLEALEYLASNGVYKNRKPGNPSMVLLDLKMPRMDGLEFLAIVKKDENFKRIPIIMLTSSQEKNDLIKSYNLGINAYVVKPLNFLALINIIKQIIIFWTLINELPPE